MAKTSLSATLSQTLVATCGAVPTRAWNSLRRWPEVLHLWPPKERTLQDIETLIHHFLNVSWGTVIPAGEASFPIEATKGINNYHLVSDGGTTSYRTRIRTPSFPALQQIPLISRGLMIPDLIAIIASIDFVMADVDR